MINNQEELRQTANLLAARGKGLLAVDESTPTIGKRLAGINVENTEENRQAYRGMLFTAEGIGEYISGVILFEETLYQNHLDGETMVSKINKLGIIPGIKVDKGLSPLAGGHEVETWCKGLEGLAERTAEYYKQGARFAKWRAVLQITADGCPTDLAIRENAWGLARYAKICQESGLVPIIEPEILMDGDHTIEKTAEVQEKVLVEVYKACSENKVFLEGTLLKPSMTVSGADNSNKASSEEVAKMTAATGHQPFSMAPSTRNHLLTKPAVSGTPMRLNPAITNAAIVNGIRLPRPAKLSKRHEPAAKAIHPMTRNSAPFVTAWLKIWAIDAVSPVTLA